MHILDKSTPIYIAGHRGLLGSAFHRRLSAEGHSRLITVGREELDLREQSAVRDFYRATRPEVVLFCAGRVGGILANRDYPADFIRDNLSMGANAIQQAAENGVKHFLFFGSSCMYPRDCAQPMQENSLLSGVPELTSLPYAMAKLTGLTMGLAYNRQYGGMRFIPVIPNNCYGPNDNFDEMSSHVLSALVAKFHQAKVQGQASLTLWGTGTPRREFVYADDVVDACLTILNSDLSTIELPINIGTGVDHSISELAGEVARVVGFGGRVTFDTSKPDGAPRKLLDSSRLSRLGWKPRVTLAEGIRRAYEWYLTKLQSEAR